MQVGGIRALVIAAALLSLTEEALPQDPQEKVFEQHCAVCHDNPATRAPSRASLRAMSPEFIVAALTDGIMAAPGSALTAPQRVSLAEYLSSQKVGSQRPMAGRCTGTPPPFSLAGPGYNGWGANPENWRFQKEPGIVAAQLERLDVKWAFGAPRK